MPSLLDGKKYATDVADVETMLRIIQSVPSPKAEPVRQWLAQVGAQRLEEYAAGLSEDQQRLLLRSEIAEKNSQLAETVTVAGVVSKRDFAIFNDWGYKGLYNGETARDIAARKDLSPREHILDHMGSEELAANWFRITQTRAKLQRDDVTTKTGANTTHYTVGREVRETIARLGGTMPEDLPTPDLSIQQLERDGRQRLEQEAQARLQLSLYSEDESTSE
jgi:DNA-damage-inducible protein D